MSKMPKRLPDGRILRTLKSGETRYVTARKERPGKKTITFDLPIETFERVETLAKAAGRKPSPHIALLLDEALAIRSLPFFPKIEGLGLISGHATFNQVAILLAEAMAARGIPVSVPNPAANAGTAPPPTVSHQAD